MEVEGQNRGPPQAMVDELFRRSEGG
ncbi:hypothetical protein NPIL_447291, partial [Nephila pilipes]